MKILVVYYSETGNTAKVAGAIHEAVSSRGHQTHLKAAGEVTADALGDYDLVFLCIVDPAWRREDEQVLDR